MLGAGEIRSCNSANKPRASVVIPCWNAEKWIARSINSALMQGDDVEVIVVNDGSTDRSLEIVESYGPRIRLTSGANCGPGSARNKGLDLATADFVLFLDADDYLEENSIRVWTDVASNVDMVLGPTVSELDGRRAAELRIHQSSANGDIIDAWVKGKFAPPCSVLWRAEFLHTIGRWREDLKRNEDGELALRALLCGARVAVSEQGLGVYVQHDDPNRVSRRVGLDVLELELLAYSSLAERALAQNLRREARAIGLAMYGMACEGFNLDFHGFGDMALMKARSAGFQGHAGSASHRAVAWSLGLKRKTQLAIKWRALRKTLNDFC